MNSMIYQPRLGQREVTSYKVTSFRNSDKNIGKKYYIPFTTV